MDIYYVYAHLDTSGYPFYVGKGHGNRCLNRHKRNPHHANKKLTGSV